MKIEIKKFITKLFYQTGDCCF